MRGYCFLPQLLPFLILALCLSFFFFHSVHKWILVGNTRSTKWLSPAVLQGELTIQKDHPPGVSPLLTLSGGNQDVVYPSSERPGEKQPVGNSEAPWTLSFAYSVLVKYLLPQPPNCQHKQTSLRNWGRKRCVRRGKEISSIYQTFLCSINSWGIYSTHRFPKHSGAGGMPTARDYKAKGTFIL